MVEPLNHQINKQSSSSSSSSSSTSPSSSLHPSIWIKLLGFVCFNGLFLTAIGSSILVLICLVRYTNSSISLYVIIPYVTYTQLLPLIFLPSSRDRDEYNGRKRWKKFSQYFPIFVIGRKFLQLDVVVTPQPEELVLETSKIKEQQQQKRQFIYGVFPHGVSSDYRILLDGMLYDSIPDRLGGENILTLAASILFRLPLVRELSLWTGCVDASRKVAEQILTEKLTTATEDEYDDNNNCQRRRRRPKSSSSSLLILPGGEAEQIRTKKGKEIVYLKQRKGFIKLAMKHRIPVVPVYVFGASDAYHTWCNECFLYEPRYWLMKNFGICIPIAYGLWGSPFCPLPVKHTVVFGKPLPVFDAIQMKKKNGGGSSSSSSSINKDNDDHAAADGSSSLLPAVPTPEELDIAHEQFCIALRQLFDEHKAKLGYGDRELEIV